MINANIIDLLATQLAQQNIHVEIYKLYSRINDEQDEVVTWNPFLLWTNINASFAINQ